MITNFESLTDELTPEERGWVPALVRAFNEDNLINQPFTNYQLAKWIQNDTPTHPNLSSIRVRKLIHFIRKNKLVKNLLASSKGYFVSENEEDIKRYKRSLQERINSITEILNSFE